VLTDVLKICIHICENIGYHPQKLILCIQARNLKNEEAKARYWAAKIQPQWVVTPGKQTTKQTNPLG
jgi:hypothetical protein